MKLDNEFTVPVAVDDAWQVLLDLERVAPCMPGATLLTHDGDEFTGTVKVKVGPIQVTYKGSAKFVERDDAAHRAVIEASGREARGSGTAAATVTTSLRDAGDGTRVLVETDLNVTGRPAQFGRGVMSEVATKLIGQFAECLSHEVGVSAPAPAEAAAAQAATAQDGAPTDAGARDEATEIAGTAEAAPTVAAPEQAPAAERATAAPPLPPTPGGMTEAAPAPPTPVPQPAQKPSTAGPTPVAPVERKPHHASEVIDLVEHAGASVAKRLLPMGLVVFLAAVIWRRRGRRRGNRRG